MCRWGIEDGTWGVEEGKCGIEVSDCGIEWYGVVGLNVHTLVLVEVANGGIGVE